MRAIITEPIYIKTQGGQEYVVRANTQGYENERVWYFPDSTRTISVGFSRPYILSRKETFTVERTVQDREIPLSDVAKVLYDLPLDTEVRGKIIEILNQQC